MPGIQMVIVPPAELCLQTLGGVEKGGRTAICTCLERGAPLWTGLLWEQLDSVSQAGGVPKVSGIQRQQREHWA